MSKWLDGAIKSGRKFPEFVLKPCQDLGFCPYGQLVEEFPLYGAEKKYAKNRGWVTADGYPDINRVSADKDFIAPKYQCGIFGHDCPVYYLAENVSEANKEELIKKIFEC